MDELYTIVFQEQPEKSEKIPKRADAGSNWNDILAQRQPQNYPPAKIKTQDQFYAKYGKPPSVTTKDILARQGAPQLPARDYAAKKSFFDAAREFAGETREKTEHVPFMCYWPSYEYMSEAQLNWYFYMRGCLRGGEYISADLSYLFVYIYELINQIGVSGPEDGFEKIIAVWSNYRKAHDKLDRYLIDWASDYIKFYGCDAGRAFDLLEKEGLFLLMPTDMLMDYYIKSGLIMPLELITRFSDYKFYESEFIKGADGSLFTDHLPGLLDKIRAQTAREPDGGFEARFVPFKDKDIKHTKIPFLRAPFNNFNNFNNATAPNARLQVYPPYEQHKPLRVFITAIIKEFENQLRALKKFKGRLRPDKLSDEIINICKSYAKDAVSGAQIIQAVEIKIDRERLLALIQDSDEVRKKLIEGNYEYGEQPEASDSEPADAGDGVPDVPQIYAGEDLTHGAPGSSRPTANKLLPDLSPVQQKILDFLLADGGACSSGELGAAFPGVFVGVEIDKINDAALDAIGDLLIGFEDERWYIMEEYVGELF